MKNKVFATIIGSRKASEAALGRLQQVADMLIALGYGLRSGGADGADSIVTDIKCFKEIILPWGKFNGLVHNPKAGIYDATTLPNYDVAVATAKQVHPAPERLSQGALKLHTRNVYQITGRKGVNRNNLSRVVVYAAPEKDGKVSGGTATAINLARKLKVPTYNVCIDAQFKELVNKLTHNVIKCEAGGCDEPAVTTSNDTKVVDIVQADIIKHFESARAKNKPCTLVWTSNLTLTASGNAVMGAGLAKQLIDRYKGLKSLESKYLKNRDIKDKRKDKYTNEVSIVNTGLHPVYTKGRHGIMAFPVKEGYWEAAKLEIIERSAKQLAAVAKKFPKMNYLLNFPGIGAGKLKSQQKEIKEILDRHLALDNVFVYVKPKKENK